MMLHHEPEALPDIPPPGTGRSGLRRLAPIGALIGVALLLWALGWHQYLSLENVAMHRQALKGFIAAHFLAALLAFVGLYIVVVALSLPGGAVMTLSGGLLFGWAVGGAAAVVGATIGATVLFLIARTSLGEGLAARAGPALAKLRRGFQDNALSYLLGLRLVPAFPFVIVNLAAALLGVPLATYVLATFVGIIPGTFAFAVAGDGLDSLIEGQAAAFDACLAARATDPGLLCRYHIDPGAILTPKLLAAFVALGVVALIPVAVKRLRRQGLRQRRKTL